MADPDRCPQDVFEILFASDVHLGHLHKDAVRSRDSQATFEEILRVGRERGVDFVLFGGDLFHQSNPPKQVVDDAIRALRTYCLGDRKAAFDLIGDLKGSSSTTANFKDASLNIALPVFAIHGVHDDPAGIGAKSDGLSILNLLHSAGLLNYFGKTSGSEEICVEPVLLQKGVTKLAMFGLGSMNEGRLNRLLEKGQVKLGSHVDGRPDNWFNVFLLHQNRARPDREEKEGKCVAEEKLDPLMDLVIWGHEAQSKIEAEWNETQRFHVSQPGSATRLKLNDANQGRKNLGLLRVATLLTPDGQEEKQFKIEKIPLQTVRQFFSREIKLADVVDVNNADIDVKTQIENICRHQIEEMISQAAAEYNGVQPKEPLVRLKVNRSTPDGLGTFETFNIHTFSQTFEGRVANPRDVVVFSQRRPPHLNPYVVKPEPPPVVKTEPVKVEQNGAAPEPKPVNGELNGLTNGLENGLENGALVNGVNGDEAMEEAAPAEPQALSAEPQAAPMVNGEAEEEMDVKDVKVDKVEVTFYEEGDLNDESLVDEVGAMSDLVQNYFKAKSITESGIYTKEALTSTMCCFAESNLTDSISQYVYKQLENVQSKLEAKLTLTEINKDQVATELSTLIASRREGVIEDDERRVLDAAIKVAEDKKAKLLARRAKEPEIEDMEVMILPAGKGRGKGTPKSKPTTVSKLSGAIGERGIPYVVLNDIPDLPPRSPQPARKSRANKSYAMEEYYDDDEEDYRPVSPKKRRR